MKITFLGTGAADHTAGLDGYRRNTSTLIDEVLIDGGATIGEALTHAQVDPALIRHLIYTHSHDDHYAADVLRDASRQFPALQSVSASAFLENRFRQDDVVLPTGVELSRVAPGESFQRGPQTWDVYEANHATVPSLEIPFNYGISADGYRILMFTDTALPHWRTVEALKDRPPAHVLIMDATNGMLDDDWRMFEHCSIAQVARVASCWRELGILRRDGIVICTHLSHSLLAARPVEPETLKHLNVQLAPEGGSLTLGRNGWRLCDVKGGEFSRLNPRRREERLAAIKATAGCLSGEEGAAFEKAVREEGERIDLKDWK